MLSLNSNYSATASVSVDIQGVVTLDDVEAFTSYFYKATDSEVYTINLKAQEGTTLSFDTVKKQIYPSISLETDTILPDDDNSVKVLKRFDITEKDTKIKVSVQLSTGIATAH